MPSPLDLVTADQLPATVRDAVGAEDLALIITAASEALAGYVRYQVHRRLAVVESAVGRGGSYLWLQSGAIRQVTRVEVRGVERESTTYALESALQGRLVARGEPWPFTGTWTTGVSSTPLDAQDTGEVVVTFDAGWVTPGQKALDDSLVVDLPASFQLAARKLITTQALRDGKDPDVTSESIGDASIGYGADSIRGGRASVPMEVQSMVARYRKVTRQ